MRDWKNLTITEGLTLRSAMQQIDENSSQICFIVSDDFRLLGALTDGDIRRALLKGASLETPVSKVMKTNPKSISNSASKPQIIEKMRELNIKHMPILDPNGQILGIEFLEDLLHMKRRPNEVILMVGGLGKRLSPLTDHLPKPMLPICGTPILERIVSRFRELGFHRFHFAVNYKAEIIRQHFGGGQKWNIDIKYIDEKSPLGTCGALSLIKERPTEPFLVMNGDLLTQANFADLLDYHIEKKSIGTMCVREFEVQVPYGVVKINNEEIESISEKPREISYINAGIYSFSPEVFKYIPKDRYMDMPSLFQALKENREATYAYKLREYWLDIGRMEDYQKAQIDYETILNS